MSKEAVQAGADAIRKVANLQEYWKREARAVLEAVGYDEVVEQRDESRDKLAQAVKLLRRVRREIVDPQSIGDEITSFLRGFDT